MTTRLLIVFLALTVCLGAAVDAKKLLAAIALVETGGNKDAIGKQNETGMYQMTPAVVAEFGGCDTDAATRAIRSFEYRLTAARIEPSPFLLACAWNGGVNAVISGRIRPAAWRYAIRVQNLMEKHNDKEK